MFLNTICKGSLLLLFFSGIFSCKKYLDEKSDQKLATPGSFEDLQAILDNTEMFKGMNFTNVSADEYYIKYDDWLTLSEDDKNGYIWASNLNDFYDWQIQYKSIFNANTVLFNLDKVPDKGTIENSNIIKGSALFFRANSFYNLAQLYAPQFNPNTSSVDLSIPLRLNADFNEESVRSTVQQTYDQIIKDLEEAIMLLPKISSTKPRPAKVAGYALLARVYLQTGHYDKAKENATAALQLQNSLIDYNTLDITSAAPFKLFNQEVILYNSTDAGINIYDWISRIDSSLYRSFDDNDLRKKAFFRDNGDGTFTFKGSYNGDNYSMFNGIATDELYLLRAECHARNGDIAAALTDLNTLLAARWITGTFVPYTASTAEQALQLVLQERKKELIFRATRWPDLRRLNKDTKLSQTIKRNLNGETYQLAPGDLRYTLLIPRQIMNITNLKQNPR